MIKIDSDQTQSHAKSPLKGQEMLFYLSKRRGEWATLLILFPKLELHKIRTHIQLHPLHINHL